eukprot:484324_1
MYIPEFCIRLNGPTSTSVHKEIAIRFATRSGMLIKLNNKYSPSKYEKFFDVSWLSAFAEEDERIFMGTTYKIELETIIIMETKNNYKTVFGSFYKLDMILSGGKPRVDIFERDIDICRWFMFYILGECKKKKINSIHL